MCVCVCVCGERERESFTCSNLIVQPECVDFPASGASQLQFCDAPTYRVPDTTIVNITEQDQEAEDLFDSFSVAIPGGGL